VPVMPGLPLMFKWRSCLKVWRPTEGCVGSYRAPIRPRFDNTSVSRCLKLVIMSTTFSRDNDVSLMPKLVKFKPVTVFFSPSQETPIQP
jgi:hypothetical protein